MIYAAIVGLALGWGREAWTTTAAVLVAALAISGVLDVARQRTFITGQPTSYSVYVENRKAQGAQVAGAWREYLMLHFATGLIAGFVAAVVGRVLQSVMT